SSLKCLPNKYTSYYFLNTENTNNKTYYWCFDKQQYPNYTCWSNFTNIHCVTVKIYDKNISEYNRCVVQFGEVSYTYKIIFLSISFILFILFLRTFISLLYYFTQRNPKPDKMCS